MGIATPPVPPILPHSKAHSQHHHQQSSILPLVLISHKSNCNRSSSCSSSMSQDYHQAAGIFSFSNNGFERSPVSHQDQQQQQQHHVAQQIRRDKLRIQASGGYEPTPPPPLVGIEEEEAAGLNPVYESAGMLSEMFNFPSGGGAASTATELMDQPLQSSYRTQPPRQQPVTANDQWFSSSNRQGMLGGLGPLEDLKNHNNRGDSMAQHHHPHHHQISAINADSAAAMQLFLMNPQPRSPSPTPSHHPPSTSSTLHMLLPNPSGSLQGFNASGPGGAFGASSVISPQQFTWVPDSAHEGGSTGAHLNNPNEIGGVVEGQGLSLSLSSSLQHLEAAKAEELRMGDGSGLLYYNQGGGSSSGAAQYFKNLGVGQHQAGLHLQGGMAPTHQVHHLGFGSSSSLGMVNVLRNSRYVKAAQELLEEFCSVGRGQFKKSKLSRQNTNPSSGTPGGSTAGAGGGGGSSSSTNKDLPSLSAAERIEHQRRKVKLLSMLDEACNLIPFLPLFLSC